MVPQGQRPLHGGQGAGCAGHVRPGPRGGACAPVCQPAQGPPAGPLLLLPGRAQEGGGIGTYSGSSNSSGSSISSGSSSSSSRCAVDAAATAGAGARAGARAVADVVWGWEVGGTRGPRGEFRGLCVGAAGLSCTVRPLMCQMLQVSCVFLWMLDAYWWVGPPRGWLAWQQAATQPMPNSSAGVQ